MSRPRPSLASSGLPTPGNINTGRRKSAIPSSTSPGPASPSKSSRSFSSNHGSYDSSSHSNEISKQLAELQAAILAKNPASYRSDQAVNSLGDASMADSEDASMMTETLASPRKSHTQAAAAMGRISRAGTPTTPSAGRPGSSLSASSYTSAHSAVQSRARTPLGGFVTPAKRKSDIHFGNSVTRSTSNASSSQPASDFQVGDKVRGLGFEGVLRFLGEVDFKAGIWGGIELSGDNAGKGKNDGSVQGVQYFACPPNCGIFVLATKIEPSMPPPQIQASAVPRPPSSLSSSSPAPASAHGPTPRRPLPRPSAAFIAPSTVTREKSKSSHEASKAAEAKIAAGSRASNYMNLTAAQIRERKLADKAAPKSPSLSPEKSCLMSSQASSVSSVGAGITPRPLRTARPSVGTAGQTPGIPRKSFGGPGTPTPMTGLRRPSTTVTARSQIPDVPVPPLPAGFNRRDVGGKESGQSVLGASTATTTPVRRYSAVSRPTTPSTMARPSSRMSNANARSVSRASSRASMASGASSRLGRPMRGNDDDEEEEILAGADSQQQGQDIKDAKEALVKATREAEQAKLELLEASTDLKDEKRKVASLQNEVQELKRKAADSRVDEASALDQRQVETEKYNAEVNRLREALEQATNDLEAATTRRSKLESEVQHLREDMSKFTASGDAAVAEKKQLMDTVETLKVAGRSLTEIYEERLTNSEAARQEVEDDLQATRQELHFARQQLELAQNDTEALRRSSNLQPGTTDAILAASLSAGMQTEQKESAALIDNENLKAELQHTRDRLSHLEEQMDDVRAELEAEVEKEKKKRQESIETSEKLKREMTSLKDMVKQAKSEKDKASQRANELQVALDENQATLEKERAELEALRSENSTRPTSAQGTVKEEVSTHSQQLALSKAQTEASDRASEILRLKEELDDLKEELKLAEEIRDESSKLADVCRSESNGALNTKELQNRHQAELASKDEEIRELNRRLALRSSASAMTVFTEPPTNDSSPISAQSYPYLSPSAAHGRESPLATSISPDSSPSLRIKRESSSSSIRRFKDEQATLRDETEGLKFLLKQANEERDSYSDQNKRLIEEAQTLRDTTRALEKTVENVMEQLASGSNESVLAPASSSGSADEASITDMKTKLAALEHKHVRDVRRLEEELNGMESLVEAKILREDELESQLNDSKRALAELQMVAHGTSARNGRKGRERGETVRANDSVSVSSRHSKSSMYSQDGVEDDDGKCEICHEQHETQDCPIFAGSSISPVLEQSLPKKIPAKDGRPYCDDCDAFGHDLANCPMGDETY